MERVGMVLVWFILLVHPLRCIYANFEGDALISFKARLADPKKALQTWDPTFKNPCTWLHVACNAQNLVTRVNLGSAGLSGTLVPQLGQLKSLEYLELYDNNISGTIPGELGDLTSLVNLDLYINNLNGPIPSTLGKLSKLRFLRLNRNRLTGSIPVTLTNIQSLVLVDLTNNDLSGVVPVNGSFSRFTPESFLNNPHLCYPGKGHC